MAVCGLAIGADAQQMTFRLGERLTYTVSMDTFDNVAFVETYVVSAGKLGERDAVELRSKIKMIDFASAAFYQIDETRTTFAAPDTGLPIYSRIEDASGPLPKATVADHQTVAATSHDLNTLIYAIRSAGSAGSFTLEEYDRTYSVSFQTTGAETVTSDAGRFETSIIGIQSEFLMERGIRDLRVNLSSDADRIPVLVRFTTDKGEFRAVISGIRITDPTPAPDTTPTPTATPLPTPVPTPAPTATPYINNQPLPANLAFTLGETLEYKISSGGHDVGTAVLTAAERTEFQGRDSLLLTADIRTTGAESALFRSGDTIRTRVDPETLSPQHTEVRFSGTLNAFTQTAVFDPATSAITVDGTNRIDAPVGAHTVLSLLYAMRSFNLKPSRDSSNPVNDTRVAVFWNDRATVFTLRPSDAEVIDVTGNRLPAQMVNITTANPQLDQLLPRVWLGNTVQRLPLRIILGGYQLDLVSSSVTQPN